MDKNSRAWLLQIFSTKIGWLVITILSTLIFGILSNFYEWAVIPTFISLIYPVCLTLIMIVYAWIINPIKDLKNKK
jgi:hypothetical protein